jgi:hypothetical protein
MAAVHGIGGRTERSLSLEGEGQGEGEKLIHFMLPVISAFIYSLKR